MYAIEANFQSILRLSASFPWLFVFALLYQMLSSPVSCSSCTIWNLIDTNLYKCIFLTNTIYTLFGVIVCFCFIIASVAKALQKSIQYAILNGKQFRWGFSSYIFFCRLNYEALCQQLASWLHLSICLEWFNIEMYTITGEHGLCLSSLFDAIRDHQENCTLCARKNAVERNLPSECKDEMLSSEHCHQCTPWC